MLDLKANNYEGVRNAARDFKNGLEQLDLQNGTILVVVPSHTASESNDGRPLARVAALLAKDSDRYIPMVDSLIRTKTVQEKKSGGARSIDVDLDSMRVATTSPPF